MNLENFFQTHAFLVSHTNVSVRRDLVDRIDWSHRMIGIRGPRGVGRTTFLLAYAKEFFDIQLRQCLYVNMNNFVFQVKGIVDFAGEFQRYGGQVLLVDQAFKLPNWCEQLVEIAERYPKLHVVFTTSTVDDEEQPKREELGRISDMYFLHGFSFREFINSQTGLDLRTYRLDEILNDHEAILKNILPHVRPWNYLQDYLHHGYYPFFLESHNFTENLLKSVNMMIEVDILFLKQIDLKYLSRLKKLLYLLAAEGITSPNVSNLAETIGTSRATVMNYIKSLEEARLVHLVYREGEEFPKKPVQIMLHNANLMYAIRPGETQTADVMETFFTNSVWRHHRVSKGKKEGLYKVDGYDICVCDKNKRQRQAPSTYFARYNAEVTHGNDIPLWLFGFLY